LLVLYTAQQKRWHSVGHCRNARLATRPFMS